MAFVAAKCPACGAQLQLDESLKQGFCQYCGSQIIIQDAINRVKIDNTDTFENLLEVAASSLEAGNGDEAFDLANRALEINPKSSRAWIVKMKSIAYIGTLGDPRTTETTTCGNNAIKFASSVNKEEVKKEVYTHYLERSLELLRVATSHLRDTSDLKQLSSISPSSAFDSDRSTRSLYLNLTTYAYSLKLCVSDTEIAIDKKYQELVSLIAQQYLACCVADTDRVSIYGGQLPKESVEARKDVLESLQSGLPKDERPNINTSKINSGSEGGCYIATAVYGSYNAPQVMILREYRDNVLAHSVLGRAFIKTYYKLSPPVAARLKGAKHINKAVRVLLDKWVNRLSNNKR